MDYWEEDGIKRFNKILKYILFIIFIFLVGFHLGIKSTHETPPVEEIVNVDSIIKVNDSIKIKIENLDSIKNAKVVEIETLDNDSTLKLFYELIRK